MRDLMTDARLQATTGIELLSSSLLVLWNQDLGRFSSPSSSQFESAWRTRHSHPFGRLACWMQLASGSEFLLKGTCLANRIDFRKNKKVPSFPQDLDAAWQKELVTDWKLGGTQTVTNYGTLGSLTSKSKDGTSIIGQLGKAVRAKDTETTLIAASFEFLQRTIRNRDAHAYVPNVRESHHDVARTILCCSYNLLIAWIPGGPQEAKKWVSEADDFIARAAELNR